MEWAEKPGYSTWLTEEGLVKHYPKEAQEYLDQLERGKIQMTVRDHQKGRAHHTISIKIKDTFL